MSYTKQHFEDIAKIIRESNLSTTHKEEIAYTFSTLFRSKNPLYDSKRFVKACGLDKEDYLETMYNRLNERLSKEDEAKTI